jgi:hypothetical protein
VDASNNVVSIDRNEKKWEKLGPGFQALEQKAMTREEFAETYEKELKDWDAKFTLKNQRLQGSLQNGSRTLWFLFHGSQYANHAEPLPKTSTNWLAKWTPAKASGHPDGQEPHRGDAERIIRHERPFAGIDRATGEGRGVPSAQGGNHRRGAGGVAQAGGLWGAAAAGKSHG